jgi:hypothetical protein
MHDMTLLDTGYLTSLPAFSLVLPLMLSLRVPRHSAPNGTPSSKEQPRPSMNCHQTRAAIAGYGVRVSNMHGLGTLAAIRGTARTMEARAPPRVAWTPRSIVGTRRAEAGLSSRSLRPGRTSPPPLCELRRGSLRPPLRGGRRLEPVVGIEPTTYGLRNRCSTTELHWHPDGYVIGAKSPQARKFPAGCQPPTDYRNHAVIFP